MRNASTTVLPVTKMSPSGMPSETRLLRASSVGVYRLWRDLGYAIGALLAGFIADAFGVPAAVWSVAVLTLVSGAVVAVRMRETWIKAPHEPRPPRRPGDRRDGCHVGDGRARDCA